MSDANSAMGAEGAVAVALTRLTGFQSERLERCTLITPESVNPVVTALQVLSLAEGEAVLNLAAPRNPVTSAVVRLSANSGLPSTLFSAAMFSVYEGVDRHIYLGAVVRVPVTAMIWQSGQLAHLLVAAVHSVAMHHDHFASFVDYCATAGEPCGDELYPDCRTSYPLLRELDSTGERPPRT